MAVFRQMLKSQLPPTFLRHRTTIDFPDRFRLIFLQIHSAPRSRKQSYCNKSRYLIKKEYQNGVPKQRRFLHRKNQANNNFAAPLQRYAKHDDELMLEISWQNNDSQKYAYPWLRDNCRCESCYSQTTLSRTVCFMDLNVEAVPRDVRISEDGERLVITWPDDHVSEYSTSWLKENRFDISAEDPIFYPKMRYWGSDMEETLKIFWFEDILRRDEELYKMLIELKTSGMCCINGAGTEEGQIKKIADRVAFLHVTYFGVTSHVRIAADATHVAFTSKFFPMHTDLSFKGRPPGALMFHCIQQAPDGGGENWFTDGFKVALDLKKSDPKAFDILCNVPMEFKDIGVYPYGRFYQRACHPVISLDRKGHPNHIYVSDHGREPMLRMPTEKVPSVYRALKKFSNIYHHPENVFRYLLQEGDILIFDNRRVLHARAPFKVIKGSNRDLETGYLEWDEIDSRIRILMEELLVNDK